jgi:hypothetical protein
MNNTQPNRYIEGWIDVPALGYEQASRPVVNAGIRDSEIDLSSKSQIVTQNAKQDLYRKTLYNPTIVKTIPLIELAMSVDQVVGTGGGVALNWGTEIAKTNITHSTSVNASRVYIEERGTYLINGRIRWAAPSGTDERAMDVTKNGSPIASMGTGAQYHPHMTGTWSLELEPGDYIELQAYQSSGSDKTVVSGVTHFQTRLRVLRIL